MQSGEGQAAPASTKVHARSRCGQRRKRLQPNRRPIEQRNGEQGRGTVPAPAGKGADDPCDLNSRVVVVDVDLGQTRNVAAMAGGRNLDSPAAAVEVSGVGGGEILGFRDRDADAVAAAGAAAGGGDYSPSRSAPLRVIAFPHRGFDFVRHHHLAKQGKLPQRRRHRYVSLWRFVVTGGNESRNRRSAPRIGTREYAPTGPQRSNQGARSVPRRLTRAGSILAATPDSILLDNLRGRATRQGALTSSEPAARRSDTAVRDGCRSRLTDMVR